MIDLAPSYKRSLTLETPLMLAAGGFDPNLAKVLQNTLEMRHDLEPSQGFNPGAFVTLPLTRRAHAGASPPRVIEIPGGALIRTGAANPGLQNVLRDYRRAWARSGATIPIIVSLAPQGARDWTEMAHELERVEGVGAIELQFNPTLDAANSIRAVRAATELPILAKLDLDNALEIAPSCVSAGANALVIARAPRVAQMVEGKIWHGRLYAPSVKPIVLEKFLEIKNLGLDAPLISCGGVHNAQDVEDFIAAGASAVQVDSAIWVGLDIGSWKLEGG